MEKSKRKLYAHYKNKKSAYIYFVRNVLQLQNQFACQFRVVVRLYFTVKTYMMNILYEKYAVKVKIN